VNDPDEIPYAPRRIGLPPTPAPKGGLDTWARIVLAGLTIGFLGWLLTLVFPNIGRQLMHWQRDPVPVAVVAGWVDRFPELPDVGSCRPETAQPADLLVALPDGRFQTPRRGEVVVECEHREVRLSIRRSARLAIAAPEKMIRNTPGTARLSAFDMNGEQLRLGEGVRVAWRGEGGIEVRGAPAGAIATLQTGSERGVATIVAEFDSLTARAQVVVE
jgi:hypothetical protein